jgi:hypothetical protein
MAMGIVAIFLSGVHLTNSHVLQNVRWSLESIAATRTLSGRAEQLRALTWTQMTDPAYLQTNALGVASDGSGDLGNLIETIHISAHLATPGTITPITIRRTADGTVKINSAGDAALKNEPSLRVDLTVNWTGKGKRTRTRQATLVVGQGGITGRR